MESNVCHFDRYVLFTSTRGTDHKRESSEMEDDGDISERLVVVEFNNNIDGRSDVIYESGVKDIRFLNGTESAWRGFAQDVKLVHISTAFNEVLYDTSVYGILFDLMNKRYSLIRLMIHDRSSRNDSLSMIDKYAGQSLDIEADTPLNYVENKFKIEFVGECFIDIPMTTSNVTFRIIDGPSVAALVRDSDHDRVFLFSKQNSSSLSSCKEISNKSEKCFYSLVESYPDIVIQQTLLDGDETSLKWFSLNQRSLKTMKNLNLKKGNRIHCSSLLGQSLIIGCSNNGKIFEAPFENGDLIWNPHQSYFTSPREITTHTCGVKKIQHYISLGLEPLLVYVDMLNCVVIQHPETKKSYNEFCDSQTFLIDDVLMNGSQQILVIHQNSHLTLTDSLRNILTLPLQTNQKKSKKKKKAATHGKPKFDAIKFISSNISNQVEYITESLAKLEKEHFQKQMFLQFLQLHARSQGDSRYITESSISLHNWRSTASTLLPPRIELPISSNLRLSGPNHHHLGEFIEVEILNVIYDASQSRLMVTTLVKNIGFYPVKDVNCIALVSNCVPNEPTNSDTIVCLKPFSELIAHCSLSLKDCKIKLNESIHFVIIAVSWKSDKGKLVGKFVQPVLFDTCAFIRNGQIELIKKKSEILSLYHAATKPFKYTLSIRASSAVTDLTSIVDAFKLMKIPTNEDAHYKQQNAYIEANISQNFAYLTLKAIDGQALLLLSKLVSSCLTRDMIVEPILLSLSDKDDRKIGEEFFDYLRSLKDFVSSINESGITENNNNNFSSENDDNQIEIEKKATFSSIIHMQHQLDSSFLRLMRLDVREY